MSRCDYRVADGDRGRCHRPATNQVTPGPLELVEVVAVHPDVVQARYCQAHAERLARHLNDSMTQHETDAHRRGDVHKAGPCAYCTPPERRHLRIVNVYEDEPVIEIDLRPSSR